MRFCQAFLHPFFFGTSKLSPNQAASPFRKQRTSDHAVFPKFYVMFPLILHQDLPKNPRKDSQHGRGAMTLKGVTSSQSRFQVPNCLRFKSSLESCWFFSNCGDQPKKYSLDTYPTVFCDHGRTSILKSMCFFPCFTEAHALQVS